MLRLRWAHQVHHNLGSGLLHPSSWNQALQASAVEKDIVGIPRYSCRLEAAIP